VKHDRKRLCGRWSRGGRAKGSNLWYRPIEYEPYNTVLEAKSRIRGKPKFVWRRKSEACDSQRYGSSSRNEYPWNASIVSTSRGTSWEAGFERQSKKRKVPEGSVTSEEGVFVVRVGIEPDTFPELPSFQQAGRGITNKGVLTTELPNTTRLLGVP
jgi:hypothetical protein